MSPQSNTSANYEDMTDEQFAAIAAAREERKKAEAIAKQKAEEEWKKAEAAAAEMDVDGEGEDDDVNVDGMDEDEEADVPKGKRSACAKGKEKEPEAKGSCGSRSRKANGFSLTLNVPPPGSHIYAPKCSNCAAKKIPCWADEKGKACAPCASGNKHCDHSSKGPAAKKKKDQEAAGNVSNAPQPSKEIYSPQSARPIHRQISSGSSFLPPSTPSRFDARPPVLPRPIVHLQNPSSPSSVPQNPAGMAMIRSPPHSPVHNRSRSSPGREVVVSQVSLDTVIHEARELRITNEWNIEAIEDYTREIAAHRIDVRENTAATRENTVAMREVAESMRRMRPDRMERRDYGERSRGSQYGGSGGYASGSQGYGSQGSWM